ncbi:RNA polymerase factor sigma-54 [Flavilitoribacter nigricans]|uniref:RNA polymerase sigma-54 factor n=1 Tax=Flavilitoribacter nigricans (strain ATCC 23147 / DSM 23189 / NBRC 102662 / NCIMB 1420 / SS-2) TaxID=1122177 RepID=A0A2D0N1D6_FLAN2|nr:RNA polymerase factor sigma-54 [Flavilitoribacter nigricans]PHN02315.1 RNA polymerase sigma-54 factor [Flavilitoribacter nigricans DSM 23189 = NBRC 102662]
MLRQTLSQKMLQKLSPQQIQLMKLLQVPTAVLEQRIKEELEANPALDEGNSLDDSGEFDLNNDETYEEKDKTQDEQYELDEYLTEYMQDDPSSYKVRGESYNSEEEKTIPIAVQDTFHEFLEGQLGLLELEDEREEAIAHQIIGSIDDDGYLRREPLAIIDDLMFSQNIFTNEQEVKAILKLIQRFDPPGIGARDLQECLRIQLEIKLEQEELHDDEQLKMLELALTIIKKHFDEFTKKHYEKLKQKLEVSESTLKAAIDEIVKLNPKPASGYSGNNSRTTQYVVPDFIISNREGELELTLNSKNAPDLRVNGQYQDMLKAYKHKRKTKQVNTKSDKEAVMFIKQKIDSAKWFIDAIRQRQQTLFNTMYAIMQYQYDYFLTGDQKKLRPMILKDIADITGLDISTISRVVNSKFVQTEFGTKLLKEFFSESLSTNEGEEVSTLEVKKVLGEIIEAENKRKPLSDAKLCKMLQDKGYDIARRTVAKYREQLNIPVARLRKEL